jgi:hypothetical protein
MENISRVIVIIIVGSLCCFPFAVKGGINPDGDKWGTSAVLFEESSTLPFGNSQVKIVIEESARRPEKRRGGGGPDSYGYTWLDSDTVGGPPYSWIEISGFGTHIEDYEWQSIGPYPLDDGTAGPYYLGFSFFYETGMFDSIYIGTNGVLSFTCSDLTDNGYFYTDGSVPGLKFPDAVVPFWNDLNLDTSVYYGGGDVYYWSNNTDMFIVEYLNVKACVYEPPSDSVTFQIILSSIDSSITYQYQTVETPNSSVDLDTVATIGIQDFTTCLGLGYYNGNWEGPMENIPHADLAVEFKKVTSHSHNIGLAHFYPVGWQGPKTDCFVEGYAPLYPWAEVVNTGQNTEPVVPVRIEVDSSGSNVYSDEVILNNIAPMEDDTAFFSAFTPAQGVYELCMHADLPGDQCHQDDSAKVTIYAQKTFYTSPFRSINPTIDGIIQSGEWTDAVKIDISRIGSQYWSWYDPWPYESPGSAFMYAKQDSQNLFLAFDIPVDTNDTKRDGISMFFEDNHNGVYEADSSEGYLPFSNRLADTTDVIYFKPYFPDYTMADTFFLVEDLERGFENNNGRQQAELKIPFGTTEFWHLNTSIGDTLSVFLYYVDRSDSIYVPELDYWAFRMMGLWPINSHYWSTEDFGELVLSPDAGIKEEKDSRDNITLAVSPNICKGNLHLHYTVNSPSNVDINLYDISGRKVKTLVNERLEKCSRTESIRFKSLPAGIYFIKMDTEIASITRKVTIVK